MNMHVSEQDLVLRFYGESAESALIDAHLEACDECRENNEKIKQTLAAVDDLEVPERGDRYGAMVFEKLRPELGLSFRPRWTRLPRSPLVRFGSLAAGLIVAFWAGHIWRPASPPQRVVEVVSPISTPARERILLVAVGDHLERSQMLLVELVNARTKGFIDISSEQQRAQDLVPENRLYRQTATSAGDLGTAGVLDDLERVLVEVAHAPAEISPEQLQALRERIESQDILFEIRVVGSRVRAREEASVNEGRPTDS